MGLVQGGGMDDGADAGHAALQGGAVGDRGHLGGVGRGAAVKAENVASEAPQLAPQRFAEMVGGAGDQNLHGRRLVSQVVAGRFNSRPAGGWQRLAARETAA